MSIKTYKKILSLILLLVLIQPLSSCKVSNFDEVKKNNALVSEYNEAIKNYNKLAAEFTELARFVDKNFNNTGISTKIWSDYDKKKSGVVSSINQLNNFEFAYRENELCMKEIIPLLQSVDKYFSEIDKFRSNPENNMEFKERLGNLYNDILKQSNIVSIIFENIYKQNFN